MATLAYQTHRVTKLTAHAPSLALSAGIERNAEPCLEPDRRHLLALLGHLPEVKRLLGRPATYLWEVKADGDGLVIEDYQRNRTYLVRPAPSR